MLPIRKVARRGFFRQLAGLVSAVAIAPATAKAVARPGKRPTVLVMYYSSKKEAVRMEQLWEVQRRSEAIAFDCTLEEATERLGCCIFCHPRKGKQIIGSRPNVPEAETDTARMTWFLVPDDVVVPTGHLVLDSDGNLSEVVEA